MTTLVAAVVAYAHGSRAIGRKGDLPWGQSLKADLKHFTMLTSTTSDPAKVNAVIMGRKTWESLPAKFRPLPHRLNVVLSRQPLLTSLDPLVRFSTDLGITVRALKGEVNVETIFIVGGGDIYVEAFRLGVVDEVYSTEVGGPPFELCDAFFPELPSDFELRASEEKEDAGRTLTFQRFARRVAAVLPVSPTPHEEMQYLNLVREILTSGEIRGDRTGVGTRSVFGRTMRFSLRNGAMPLLTTKRTFWRGVAVELLWFISGSTDAGVLKRQNVNIWDGNSSRAYLDSIGLGNREEGDLGPVYGFQWRHFGAAYGTMHDSYAGQGVDQLAELIAGIKRDPTSRRHIMSAWNPCALKQMALPPCHVMCQFYVSSSGELSCQMIQRSADMGLGVPFNIASYALLTHLVAHACGLQCGDLVHVMGDCHVYRNHENALWEQLKNEPRPFPTLKINTTNTDLDKITFEDLELVGYDPHKAIKMDMAV